MSWPGWQSTVPPIQNLVPTPSRQSAVISSAINPAPAIVAPAAPASLAAGVQYSPEQWAQIQQQNWQQWAQWQQQYQQWHQQYGAEYQKSLNALSVSNPNTSIPPPPPIENNKPPPPPPPEDNRINNFKPIATGYTTTPRPNQQYNWPNPGKRPLPQAKEHEKNKRQMLDVQNNYNKQIKGSAAWQNQPPPNSQTQSQKVTSLEELTEAENKFDKEFTAWEGQFNKWKEQNANHPDKTQYLQYEKKWEAWRNSLLDRREQMRKKRISLQAAMSTSVVKPPFTINQTFREPPPQKGTFVQENQFSENLFSRPPPTQNDEPLNFNSHSKCTETYPQNGSENLDTGVNFLKSSSPGPSGIPGLDLVKEGADQEEKQIEEQNSANVSKGPDLDAISKGINSILGDTKLLNILSMVSKNQNLTSAFGIDNQSKSESSKTIPSLLNMPVQRPGYEQLSNQELNDDHSEPYKLNQFETVNNFDDQTRMSFTNGPNDQEFSYESSYLANRTGRTNNFYRQSFNVNLNGNFNKNVPNSRGGDSEGNDFMHHHDSQSNFNNTYQTFNKYETQNHFEDENEEPWKKPEDFDKYNIFSEECMPHQNTIENVQSDEPLFVPQTVIDYEHKRLKEPEPEITVDIIRSFDYRHKQVNRIPYPQRPIWLSSTLRNIQQFDPLGTTRFNTNDRTMFLEREPSRYPPERSDTFSRRPHLDEKQRNNEFSRDRHFNRRATQHDHTRFRSDVNQKQNQEMEAKNPSLELEELSDDDEWMDEKRFGTNKENSAPQKVPDNPHSSRVLTNQTPSQNTTLECLINPPGRYARPVKIVIILRGPPGSGKSYLAKLIKDKEVENGGSAPRILSLDDFFLVGSDSEELPNGKYNEMKYKAELEEPYRQELIKVFKKTITEGYFQFIVVDNVNQKVKNFGEMWSFAKQNGFQVYICQLDLDPELCTRRNIHNRSRSYIEDCIAGWEPTPAHHPLIDATNFLQSPDPIAEVEMEEADQIEEHEDDIGEVKIILQRRKSSLV
ncbi:hypothetical protein ABEB36_005260 [Hypothenemus hampei]|uniref:YLP motif-containing protein 1 n=1 Tax=Hypothenemus hampei TaxID=57062 RepID=A0ABD1EXK8_HYPHA